MMSQSTPFSMQRLGGSDTNAVVDYMVNVKAGKKVLEEHLRIHLPACAHLNGFFSKSKHIVDEYVNYIEILHYSYLRSRCISICNWQWLKLFYAEELEGTPYSQCHPDALAEFIEYSKQINLANKQVISYSHFEDCASQPDSFLWCLKQTYQNKKVLVVSSHKESILANLNNINRLFPGFSYGDIRFEFFKPPITYAGLDLAEDLADTWFEVLRSMAFSISLLKPSLVLLSCGSYALPLSHLLLKQFGISAIHVGGILQLYFGVMGGRWRVSPYCERINSACFINALPSDSYRNKLDQNLEPSSAYF